MKHFFTKTKISLLILSIILTFALMPVWGCGESVNLKSLKPISLENTSVEKYEMPSQNQIYEITKKLSDTAIGPVYPLTLQEFIEKKENESGYKYTIGCLYYKSPKGKFIVYSILPNSFLDGKVKTGDTILKINGVSPDKFIPQKEGQDITVTYKSQKDGKIKTIKSKVGIIHMPSAYGDLLANGKIVYIAIKNFNKDTYKQLSELLETVNNNSIIIDLRNTTGDNLDAMLQSLSLFMPSKQVGFLRVKSSVLPLYVKSSNTDTANHINPEHVIIIVNSKTGGVAEFFAYVLQRNQYRIAGEEIKDSVVLNKYYRFNNSILSVPYAIAINNNKKSIELMPNIPIKDDGITCDCSDKAKLLHKVELILLSEDSD